MSKFISTILCVSVFFVGLGSLINMIEAKFKSDEHAFIVVKQSRFATSNESNVTNVNSLPLIKAPVFFRQIQVDNDKPNETISIQSYSINPPDTSDEFERLRERDLMSKSKNP